MKEVIALYAGKKPMLGICLGEQAIGEVFGAKLKNLKQVFHGIQTPVRIVDEDEYIFRGLAPVVPVGRYHSWVVDSDSLPSCLKVTSFSPEGYIMSLRHRIYDIHGLQFHPESILTQSGRQMIANFLKGKGGKDNEVL